MPLKIGLVLDDGMDTPDGIQQYLMTIGEWLGKQGHQVHYLVGETRRTDMDNLHSLSRNLSVRFNRNRMSMPVSAPSKRIRQILEKEQFDVLHVQMPYSPLLAGKIVRAAPAHTTIIGTFQIIPYSRLQHHASRLLGVWQRNGLRRFDYFLSASAPAQRYAAEAFKVDSTVLSNAVNITHLRAGRHAKASHNVPITITFLGRLVPRKGCLQLLQAVRVLRDRSLPGFKVIIAGDGALAASLKQYAKSHDLEGIVDFRGFIPEDAKANLLASSDIAVFPSLGGESFGIVLLEAIAAGADVVIGGDNEGYKTILGQWPECLIDPRNTAAFADRLELLMRDEQLRNKLHEAQSQRVLDYDVETVCPRLMAIYESAIAKRRRINA